jgi:hypothetical protein
LDVLVKQNPDFSRLKEDPLGMDEETQTVNFSYLECREEDGVPDFVVEKIGLWFGKKVKIEGSLCGGTMK